MFGGFLLQLCNVKSQEQDETIYYKPKKHIHNDYRNHYADNNSMSGRKKNE